jgi:dTDP-4-dehydrorhamnose 3,5-epimerase
MQFKATSLAGLTEIYPAIFEDERGLFFETYNQRLFAANGIPAEFVQDNQSWSRRGVLRGLHLQHAPYAQGKLVRCVSGRVLDVAVDIRPDSPTFGRWEAVELDAQRGNMLYLPEGFAHGFVALEDAVFAYKCTNFYHKASEAGIRWDDPELAIDWGIQNPIVSAKDQVLPSFAEFSRQLADLPA